LVNLLRRQDDSLHQPHIIALPAVALAAAPAVAGTAIMITDANGVVYSGKTMEYAAPIPLEMTYMPAGTGIVSLAPDGSDGARFITKYAIFGGAMPASGLPGARQGAMIEAINDQGLSVSTNQLNGSMTPADLGTDKSKILAASDLANWLLGSFSSVEDAKATLENGSKVPVPGLTPGALQPFSPALLLLHCTSSRFVDELCIRIYRSYRCL
jgi:choloylglycine hydrolase